MEIFNTEKKNATRNHTIHPVHESELWFPVVLISLSNPSTASPRCDGDISPSISPALGPILVSLSCSRRITVAGGLLSCIGDPRFLGGVRCVCFFVRGWTILEDNGEGRPGRSGVLWKGVEVKPVVPIRGVFIWDDEDGKDVKCLRDERGGVERTESESRGHLRLCASSSETRRSNWWSVTLRIALCSLERRRLAFYTIVRAAWRLFDTDITVCILLGWTFCARPSPLGRYASLARVCWGHWKSRLPFDVSRRVRVASFVVLGYGSSSRRGFCWATIARYIIRFRLFVRDILCLSGMSIPGIAYHHWLRIGQAAERIPAAARVRCFLPSHPLGLLSVYVLQISEKGGVSWAKLQSTPA